MFKPLPPLLWLDIETTGLNETQQPLELALVATDANLDVEDSYTGIFQWDKQLHDLSWSPVAKIMHVANGLIKAITSAGPQPESECEWLVVEGAKKWIIDGGYSNRHMGGSSVQFDRRVGRYWFPELVDMFSYRNFDVRTLRTWYGIEKPEVPHRALGDLLIDIETVRQLRKSMLSVGA